MTESLPFFRDSATGTLVKICGITSVEDAEMAVSCGADAIGVNLFPGSRRHVELRKCREWLAGLAGRVARIAVVVNPTAAEITAMREAGCFDAVQFHGNEPPSFCREAGFPHWIKAVSVRDSSSLSRATIYETPHVLLDAWSPDAWGGTGLRVDWDLARDFVDAHRDRRVILAGGLHPGNLRSALRIVRPFAVDVASGVESEPRQKDEYLVREFVQIAKRWARPLLQSAPQDSEPAQPTD